MRRHLLLSVTLPATLMLTAATGCGDPMSDEGIQRTVEDVIEANMAVETIAFELAMEATVDVQGATGMEQTSIQGAGSGVVDNASRTMHMVMSMTTTSAGQDPLAVPVEYFLVDGWMYVSATVPGEEAQWMKMRVPEGMWEQQN